VRKQYKIIGIEKIKLSHLYNGYKKDYEKYYEAYFGKEGNPLSWKNVPIAAFAFEYCKIGDSILDKLDDTSFIKYEYDKYSYDAKVKDDTHKWNAANRLIKLIKSIKKYGYGKGKFSNPKYLVNVIKGASSPFGNDLCGYTLLSRKHRAAACFGLGINTIKAKVHVEKIK